MNVIDAVIAWEIAKEACKQENIEKRAAEKAAELFPQEWIDKAVAEFMETINDELKAMRREVL